MSRVKERDAAVELRPIELSRYIDDDWRRLVAFLSSKNDALGMGDVYLTELRALQERAEREPTQALVDDWVRLRRSVIKRNPFGIAKPVRYVLLNAQTDFYLATRTGRVG